MSVLTLCLLILGLVLLVVEAHVPTYGALGAAGLAAVVAGLVLLVLGSGASLLVALALAVPVTAAAGLFGAVTVRKVRAATRRRARCGAEGLVGRVGVVRRSGSMATGQVALDGALWRARRSWADEDGPPPGEGDPVVVDHVRASRSPSAAPTRGRSTDDRSAGVPRVPRGSPPRSWRPPCASCASTSAASCSGSGGWSARRARACSC